MSIASVSLRSCGELRDFRFLAFEQRQELLHFIGKPADFRIAIIAAARLIGAIASKERPVHWALVGKPEPDFCQDLLPRLLPTQRRQRATLRIHTQLAVRQTGS